jgi:predicted  nucleic acid-binding Zn-ribbon protein
VAEKRGREVVWSLYTEKHEAFSKVAQLRAEADQSTGANAQIQKDLRGINIRMNAAKAELARTNDSAKKQDMQKQLGELQSVLTAKSAEIKPVVAYAVAGPYARRQVDDFLLRLEKEAGPENVRPLGQ